MVKSEQIIGTTGYLTLKDRCQLKRCHYKQSRLHVDLNFQFHYASNTWCLGTVTCLVSIY